MGLGSWMGYALAAIYYVGTDYGFGDIYCEILSYGYYVIDGLNYLVSFAGGDAPAEPAKAAATDAQKKAAAAAAAAALAAAKKK